MRFDDLQYYRVNIERDPDNGEVGTFPEFVTYHNTIRRGEYLTNNMDFGSTAIRIDGMWFTKDLFEPIKIPSRILKEDERQYADFKVGDLVKIRTVEDLTAHYYSSDKEILTEPLSCLIENVNELKNETAEITVVEGEKCRLSFTNLKLDGKWNRKIYCFEMLEIVEEGYRERIMARNTEVVEKEKISDEIIEEMISKVDVKKMKKIIASSFRMKATELKGIEKLLYDWANAKKEIYMMFGRNLTLRKPIEYEMTDKDVYEKINVLTDKFPRNFNLVKLFVI
jgi:hypothetical protein